MPSGNRADRCRKGGFTMIELLVALAIVAVMLTVAAPHYFGGVDRAKDDVLREDLYSMRDSLDKYFADNGKYPDSLANLVDHRYLRAIPVDPLTGSNTTWVEVPPTDKSMGGVYDVKSAAPGKAKDGSLYKDW